MSFENPTDEELRLLAVLVGVCRQHMHGSHNHLDHYCMSAGEHAVDLLVKYGLIVEEGRGGAWTTKVDALERLDDLDLSNVEQVRAQLQALAKDELLPVHPGARPHLPDVQLGHLRLWFLSFATPKTRAKGWLPRPLPRGLLNAEVRLEPVDAMCVARGEIFMLPDVRKFRDQLAAMVQRANGRADWVAHKAAVMEVHLKVANDEMVTGEMTVRNPLFNHSLSFKVTRLRLSQLPSTIAQFDRVFERFERTGESR